MLSESDNRINFNVRGQGSRECDDFWKQELTAIYFIKEWLYS